ncbi:MAG: hypothetical protein AAF539_10770 [Planctomycetota bacterium]
MLASGRRHSLRTVVLLGLGSVIGCQQGAIFNRHHNQAAHVPGSPTGVQVTQKSTDDGEMLQSPPQRLAQTQFKAKSEDQATNPNSTDATKANSDQKADKSNPSISTRETHAAAKPTNQAHALKSAPSSTTTASHKDAQNKQTQRKTRSAASMMAKADTVEMEQSLPSRSELSETLAADASLAGVNMDELLKSLQDAPPNVQRLAVARMLAMSRRRAQSTDHPDAIDQAIEASLASLPTLPEHVLDNGQSPTPLASTKNKSREEANDLIDETASSEIAQVSHETTSDPVQASMARHIATSESNDARESMTNDELFRMLRERLSQPTPGESESEMTRREVMLRHLMVLAGDPDAAISNLDSLDEANQEYLRHQLFGLWTILDPNGHPATSRRFSSALPSIRQAASFLAAGSDSLDVRSLEFCTAIEAYGQIQPFPNRKFKPGQEIILYCEIDNFVANPVEAGYETKLQGSYEVLDSDGGRVLSQSLPMDRQVSRNRLRDYFIAYQMHLPKSLASGEYSLRLTMEDVHGKKYGQSTVDFRIASAD